MFGKYQSNQNEIKKHRHTYYIHVTSSLKNQITCMLTLQIHSAYYRNLIKQVSNNLSLQQISFSSKSNCRKSLTKKNQHKIYHFVLCLYTGIGTNI